MSTAVIIGRLDHTATGDVISSSTDSSYKVTMGSNTGGMVCYEALAIANVTAVTGSGNVTLDLYGSVDGGTTYTKQGTLGALSAVGTYAVRIQNVAPILRWHSTLNSGTSITVVLDVIGLQPTDSKNASDTPIASA